jgi:hypothetical protein
VSEDVLTPLFESPLEAAGWRRAVLPVHPVVIALRSVPKWASSYEKRPSLDVNTGHILVEVALENFFTRRQIDAVCHREGRLGWVNFAWEPAAVVGNPRTTIVLPSQLTIHGTDFRRFL